MPPPYTKEKATPRAKASSATRNVSTVGRTPRRRQTLTPRGGRTSFFLDVAAGTDGDFLGHASRDVGRGLRGGVAHMLLANRCTRFFRPLARELGRASRASDSTWPSGPVRRTWFRKNAKTYAKGNAKALSRWGRRLPFIFRRTTRRPCACAVA